MSSILPCVLTRVKLSCPWIQHTWFTGHWHRGCRKYGQEGPGTGSFASCIAIPGSGKLISLTGCSHEAFVVFRDISCATNASWAHLSSGKLIPLAPDIELRLRALNGFVFLDKPMKINYCRSWFGTNPPWKDWWKRSLRKMNKLTWAVRRTKSDVVAHEDFQTVPKQCKSSYLGWIWYQDVPMTCIFKPVKPLKTRPNFQSKPGAPIWKAAAGRNMETSSQTWGAKGGS